MWVKGKGNNVAPVGNFLGAVEQHLMAFMHSIKDADDYDVGLAHIRILPYLVRRCKNRNGFRLAAFIFQKSDEAIVRR